MRKAGIVLGLVLGVFLIFRAIVEPFLIDLSDPSSYRHDWGGPTLFGVLLVHCGPGVVAALVFAIVFVRRRSRRLSRSPATTPPGGGLPREEALNGEETPKKTRAKRRQDTYRDIPGPADGDSDERGPPAE